MTIQNYKTDFPLKFRTIGNKFKEPQLVPTGTNIYRPTTKLREGNVISRVCLSIILSVGGEGGVQSNRHHALDFTTEDPIDPGTGLPQT